MFNKNSKELLDQLGQNIKEFIQFSENIQELSATFSSMSIGEELEDQLYMDEVFHIDFQKEEAQPISQDSDILFESHSPPKK